MTIDANDGKAQKSFIRCPKCRSINPVDAEYCVQCGKVFSSRTEE